MAKLHKKSGSELVALASTVAIAISKDISSADLVVWGAFFTALGDNMALIAVADSANSTGINKNVVQPEGFEPPSWVS